MPYPAVDWRDALIQLLISAGTNGLQQRVLIKRVQSWANADTVVAYLESLLASDKVQKFEVASGVRGGRPSTIWRATVRILEGDLDE